MQNEMENKMADSPESVQGEVGPVDYLLDYAEGQILVTLTAVAEHASVVTTLKIDAEAIMRAIAAATPGSWDDALVEMILKKL